MMIPEIITLICCYFLCLQICTSERMSISRSSSIKTPKFFAESRDFSANSSLSSSKLNVSIITWNLAEQLTKISDVKFLKSFQNSSIVVLGCQELENIRPRRRLGSRHRQWNALIKRIYGEKYNMIASHKMGGLHLSIFADKQIADAIHGTQIIDIPCGVGNVLVNKGAICALLRFNNATLTFINAHLAAHPTAVQKRNQDYHRIMSLLVAQSQKEWILPHFLEAWKHDQKHGISTIPISKSSKMVSSFGTPLSQCLHSIGLGGEQEKTTIFRSSYYSFSSKYPLDKNERHRGQALNKEIDGKKTKTSTKRRVGRTQANEMPHISEISDPKSSFPKKILSFKRSKLRNNQKSRQNELESKVQGLLRKGESPFDGIFFFGDLNYRVIGQRRNIEKIRNKFEYNFSRWIGKHKFGRLSGRNMSLSSNSSILKEMQSNLTKILDKADQLAQSIKKNTAFNKFQEDSILFLPSFKYDLRKFQFDSSRKARSPSWTDRILFKVSNISSECSIVPTDYDCIDCRVSDHRPVYGVFNISLAI